MYIDKKNRVSRLVEKLMIEQFGPDIFQHGFYKVSYKNTDKNDVRWENIQIDVLTHYYANQDGRVWNFETKRYIVY